MRTDFKSSRPEKGFAPNRRSQPRPSLKSHHSSAYTLLEVIVASVLVAVLMVGAMNAVGASLRGAAETAQRQQAVLLAEDLMGEVMQRQYIDPDETPYGYGWKKVA